MDDDGSVQNAGIMERWVGNFGSPAERKAGVRRFGFQEGLKDVAADVCLCLGVLPLIGEKLSSEAFCEELCSGFHIVSALICEAAQKTIGALEAERRAAAEEKMSLAQQIYDLREVKAGTEQVVAGVSDESGACGDGVGASRDVLAGKA